MATVNDRPVAIAAKLNYTGEQAAQLSAPHSNVKELRPLLRGFHDALLAELTPRLLALRTQGVVIDYGSSWLLGEFVAHAPESRVAEAMTALSQCAQLKDVERPDVGLHKSRRR